MKLFIPIIIILSILSTSLLAQKKIDSLQKIKEIKISAVVGNELGAFNLPASAQYISSKKLQEQKYSDVHRILKQVPGVNIQEEDGFGLRPNIGMRGTGSERSSKITIMEDGILMAPAAYSAAAAYYFPTAARMSGLEVVKGSSQIRFGPNTTGGVLNFISSPMTQDFSGDITLSAGSYGSHSVLAKASGTYKQIGFLAQTYQAQSAGFKTLPSGDNTGFKVQDYLIKVSYSSKPIARYFQRVELKVAENNQESNETYLGISAQDFLIDPYQRYDASRFDNINLKQNQYVLKHQIYFTPNSSLQTSVYRTDFSRNWYKTDKVTDTAGVTLSIANVFNSNRTDFVSILKGERNGSLALKANNRVYYSQGAQTAYQTQFEMGDWKHQMIVGMRLHQDAFDRFQWVDNYQMKDGVLGVVERGIQGTESNRIQKATALAAYIQYEIGFKKWRIIPGLRYENIHFEKQDYGKSDTQRTGEQLKETANSSQIILPGFGMAYAWNDNINLIAGVHKGFSPSGFTEDAQAEQSTNYELGGKYLKSGTQFSLIGFYTDYSNLLGADNLSAGGAGSGDLFNGGEARAFGLELSAHYDLLRNNEFYSLPVGVSYTFTQAQFLNTFESDFDGWGNVQENDFLPYLPKQQLGLNIGFEMKKLSLYYNYKFQTEVYTVAGTSSLPSELIIPEYAVADLAINYDINTRIQLFGNVLNLMNKQYIAAMRPAGLRPGMPRALRLGVKFELK